MTDRTTSRITTRRIAEFRALHEGDVLVLPNAWDAASAGLLANAGVPAVATTSAGVAWTLGFGDGNQIPQEQALAMVRSIVALVDVPVTADLESGYGETPSALTHTVHEVLAAGAAGVNIEDSSVTEPGRLRDAAEQADRLRVIRKAATTAGHADLFVNARVDTYVLGAGELDTRVAATVDRARAYVRAGADGIFIPGVLDPALIRTLAASVDVPLNVMAGPGSPPVSELAAAGARRVSVGPALAQIGYAAAVSAAKRILATGQLDPATNCVDFAEVQALLTRRQAS